MNAREDNHTISKFRRVASGAVAVAAVIAANLVLDAEDARGEEKYDISIPSAPVAVDATRVAAPRLPDLVSLEDVDFVVPVLERREAVLPELPEVDGAPWIKNGVPPAPRAEIEVAAPTIEGAEALDEIRIEVPELRLPESADTAASDR